MNHLLSINLCHPMVIYGNIVDKYKCIGYENGINISAMGKIIENYELRNQIGAGVYAKVYRGINRVTGQEVAIKVISVNKFREVPKLQQCTINQIKALTELPPCPYIVRYIDMLKTNNNYYFVYEYCNGGTLDRIIRNNPAMPQRTALQFIRQLFQAFKVLSRAHIMHRDLKPDNILLHNGCIKVADFGFCKPLKDGNEMVCTMLGSPIYMAPQILKGQTYTIKADIWSLGVVAYQLLFGRCPFQSKTIAKLINILDFQQIIIPPQPKISHTLEVLLRQMLVKEPYKRIEWQQVFKYTITEQGEIYPPTYNLNNSNYINQYNNSNNNSNITFAFTPNSAISINAPSVLVGPNTYHMPVPTINFNNNHNIHVYNTNLVNSANNNMTISISTNPTNNFPDPYTAVDPDPQHLPRFLSPQHVQDHVYSMNNMKKKSPLKNYPQRKQTISSQQLNNASNISNVNNVSNISNASNALHNNTHNTTNSNTNNTTAYSNTTYSTTHSNTYTTNAHNFPLSKPQQTILNKSTSFPQQCLYLVKHTNLLRLAQLIRKNVALSKSQFNRLGLLLLGQLEKLLAKDTELMRKTASLKVCQLFEEELRECRDIKCEFGTAKKNQLLQVFDRYEGTAEELTLAVQSFQYLVEGSIGKDEGSKEGDARKLKSLLKKYQSKE